MVAVCVLSAGAADANTAARAALYVQGVLRRDYVARPLKATLPIRHEVVGYWSKNRLGVDTAIYR